MLAAVAALKELLQNIPARHRAKVYSTIGVLSSVATLAVLVLANHELLGVDVPSRWMAIATGASALLSALARANTDTKPAGGPDNHGTPFGGGH